MAKHGEGKWAAISGEMTALFPNTSGSRLDNQNCYQRWHRNLRPGILKGPWTEQEEKTLVAAHRRWAKGWARWRRKGAGALAATAP